MKSKALNRMLFLLLALPLLSGCNEDDDPSERSAEKSYALAELGDSGVSGTVSFSKVDDTTTKILVELAGTSEGDSHPAHIHAGDAATGGNTLPQPAIKSLLPFTVNGLVNKEFSL